MATQSSSVSFSAPVTPSGPNLLSIYDISGHEAVEAIARCYSEPVSCSVLSLVDFGGVEEEIALKCPVPGFALSFCKGDYLHIKQERYKNDWMIGRIVGHKSVLGFLPSCSLLKSVVKERRYKDGHTSEDIIVYKQAPILRPIVIMGPSLKKYELTRLLQKALVSHIKKQFSDRLIIIKRDSLVSSLSPKEASSLKKQIFAESDNDHMVLLDCDASFPFEIKGLNIDAIIIYIQINQKKILSKLVKEHCKNSAQLEEQLQAAYQLYDLPHSNFSLIISDANLQDAAQNLELFIESYWACTHPPLDPNFLNN